MNRNYAHVIELVRARPWAILPDTYKVIRAILNRHVAGDLLSELEVREEIAAAQAQYGDRSGAQQTGAGVAILPLYGPIVPKAGLMSDLSGATSVQGFMRMFRSALVDAEVKAIIIDVDSPGGLTDLVPEAAAEIRAARGQKPIVAVANTLMASAAYWLACQADEIVASPSALVGSIGVYTEHDDMSGAYALAGVSPELISAGKYKVEGNDLGPLDEEARRHVQALVDDAYGSFVNDVAKARGVKPDDVRNGYGQGRVLTAKMALAESLVDRVDTLDATIKRMVWVAARQKPAQAEGWVSLEAAREAEAFTAQVSTLVGDEEELETPDVDRFAFERELLESRR
jgi:signal peptide peptidase SppA